MEERTTSSNAEDDGPSDVPTPRLLAWARNSAAWRLSRAMMSEKQLRDAIIRKARTKFDPVSDAQLAAMAEAAIRFGHETRALDDENFAGIATRSAVRSGRSKRAIAQKLAQKGIDRETAQTALSDADDFYAALVHARKRGFGPFRRQEPDENRFNKEMASFGRAGFSFEIARRVLDMDRDEAEEALAAGGKAGSLF